MMIRCVLLLLYCISVTDALHFNGGTISWLPISPYDNSSSITITIIQSYWWSYPTIKCAINVPISTSSRSGENVNLTCVTDCSTDGGYSISPVNILTDCTSSSTSLGMMGSQRSVNTTLTAGAHFYLAYTRSAWRSLNYPAKNGLDWSIVSYVDLRIRTDGFINTPPVASVISPQYVIVNRTTQIRISVSDVNTGDNVRCRWSTYTAGSRKRKRSIQEERKNLWEEGKIAHVRKKRDECDDCEDTCARNCDCDCVQCSPTTCMGGRCKEASGCPIAGITTTKKTTIDALGTPRSTLSYANRQPIDECGGICYPSSVPSGTTLSNCTLSFTGPHAGTWYAIAIQVEDFIDPTSTTPMSSIPVQFLIYVLPEPICSAEPTIIPLSDCLEVTVGVSKSFNISVLNLCESNTTKITDIIQSKGITGMQVGNLTEISTNSSMSYVTLMWTPQANQIGLQELCMIAFTDERVQSTEYCVTFIVMTSSEVCKTTTTTSTTSSTSTSTSSTATITTTTLTTMTTFSSTATTSITITAISSTFPNTIFTSVTTTTAIVIITVAATTTTTITTPGKDTSWGLIAGISSLAFPLALCACCCLYRLCWSPAAKRRRHEEEEEEEERWKYGYLTSSTESMTRTSTPNTKENVQIEVPKKSFQVYNIFSQKSSTSSTSTTTESGGSILVAIYNNTNARRADNVATHNTRPSLERGMAWMQPLHHDAVNGDVSVSEVMDFNTKNESFCINRQLSNQEVLRASSEPSFNAGRFSALQSPPMTAPEVGQGYGFKSHLYNFKDWTRLYLFGHKRDTAMPRIPRPS